MIHRNRAAGWTHVQLCREYGISSTQLARILNGTQWQDVYNEVHHGVATVETSHEPSDAEVDEFFAGLKDFIHKPPTA